LSAVVRAVILLALVRSLSKQWSNARPTDPAPASLRFMLIGVLVTLPAIIGYTVFSYRVFCGRSSELSYE